MKITLPLALACILCLGIFPCKAQNAAVQSQAQTTVSVEEPKSVDIRGEQLHYIEQGKGEPLIFIHGTVGDYRAWIPRMEPYGEDYHVVAYSRRYAHPNQPVFDESADYSVRIHADDLYALIKELGLEKVHLVGHSYGAYTALTMALDHPEVVQSMVLGEPPAAPLLDHSEAGKASFDRFIVENLRPAGQAFREEKDEEGVELFLRGVLGDEFSLDQTPPEVKQAWMDNLSELWGAAMTESFIPLAPVKIQKLDVPVLLLVGDRSPTWLVEISNELHRLLPQSELVRFDDISHGLFFEDPKAVDEAMRAFLEGK